MSLRSRPVRLAAEICAQDEAALEHLFAESRVLVRLEDAFAHEIDARETFLFAVNQVIRFCPNVAVCVPASSRDLVDLASDIAARVHGHGHSVAQADLQEASTFQAAVNVGTKVFDGLPWVTVNSTNWLARVVTANSGCAELHWAPGNSNPIGALAAACLGAGRAFLFLVGQPLVTQPIEVSLFSHEVGTPGTLSSGPPLPVTPVEFEGLLVGCGAVTNGWAYTVKRLPIVGRLEAVDRQTLKIENLGPYAAADREWLGQAKAEMIASLLGPSITVTPRPEEWELFAIRLRYGVRMPSIVVNGVDNVETRHAVQRRWPDALIDMAAGVIFRRNGAIRFSA